MLIERIEYKWIEAFRQTFQQCQVQAGEVAAILCETQSRRVNVDLARLALEQLGASVFEVTLTTPRAKGSIPVRSTGASDAIQHLAPVIESLRHADFIVDCTVEGLLHAPELPQIMRGVGEHRPRLLMVSNEHPEILERTVAGPQTHAQVRSAMKQMKSSQTMRVTSEHGSDLSIQLDQAVVGGVWGYAQKPGMVSHWPGGLVLAFPAAGSVSGRLVMAPGDVNLTFKNYLTSPIELTIEKDEVVDINGHGADAEMMKSYWKAWEDLEGHRACYATSHVGFGLNAQARWDALAFYDKRDCNGTELRAFAGNFLYSTGANEVAGRHTLGHFDLPMRGCTIALDGVCMVRSGEVQWDQLETAA